MARLRIGSPWLLEPLMGGGALHGFIEAAIDDDDTTLQVAHDSRLDVLDGGGDYIAIVLDPLGWYGAPEIVHATDYDGAGSLTISRGEEGTTARAHPVSGNISPTRWMHAASAEDFATSGGGGGGPGEFAGRTVLSSGSGTFTTGASTTLIHVRGVGGGGQGGGATSGSSQAGAGQGGCSGGYFEAWISVSPSTGYSYVIGAAGSASTGASTGESGGNTTLTVGGTTYEGNGGPGGSVMAAGTGIGSSGVGGGVGGTASNGDVNVNGRAGWPAWRPSGSLACGGYGADSMLGLGGSAELQGGSAANAGRAATGFGAGGGGAISVGNAGAANGGAGSSGALIIDEYS